jgi:thioredoxin reductase
MAVDTPARIAILGAGPIGLEAALYARFLGYDVDVFDRGDVAQNVRNWGHVRMFSPFAMNSTPLGLAALSAQGEHFQPPGQQDLLTGREWVDRYLVPLSHTDLLADQLRLHTEVIAVARQNMLKQDCVADEQRAESPFRIVFMRRNGLEAESTADVVIDATGVSHCPNYLGDGGAPALGELLVRGRIRYDLPDAAGAEQAQYAGKRVLVVGGGYSAATSVVALSELARRNKSGEIVWLTRALCLDAGGPVPAVIDDPLPERSRLTSLANQAAAAGEHVTHVHGTWVKSVAWEESRSSFSVEFAGQRTGAEEFDEIIANVGYHPDNRLYAQLQVHECYATGGPMKLAARLIGSPSGDCLQQRSHGAESLLNPEPNFYILGAKSYGRRSDFLVSVGFQQIRELFALIGDRAELDLYRGAAKLPGGQH